MAQPFDFDKALQSGQTLTGKDGILTPLIKQLTEAALAGAVCFSGVSGLLLSLHVLRG